jgi:hypothetical protein
MIRIDGLGVKNLRSLKNLDVISLKPINILVGRNSAGKSTFARLLPLLKQSSERRKSAPILWYGRLVDFGAFDDVYSSLSVDGYVDIVVRFEISNLIFLMRRPFWRESDIPLEKNGTIEATFRLGRDGEDGKTVLRELHLDAFGVNILLTLSQSQVTAISADGTPLEIPSNIRLNWTQGNLMPILRNINLAPTPQSSLSDESLFVPRRVSRFGATDAKRAVAQFMHGNTQEDRMEEIADRLPLGPIEELLAYCNVLPSSTVTWKTTIAQSTIKSASVRKLHSALIVYKLDLLLALLDDAALRHLSEVSYLEPLRATAQRYYRREEISTDELDPKGLNTPFFIQGLTPKEKESLQTWTAKNFGFSLSVKNSAGHLSLIIQPTLEGSASRNMADVGLGYSQLVPVAVQLWAAHRRTGNTSTRRVPTPQRAYSERAAPTVVVEQPELHLHPAYQARLADVFSVAIKPSNERHERGPGLTIVAETHSPNLIARLGELINQGDLSAELVQILVFEDNEDSKQGTRVRVATFDEEGVLSNWPIGFFDA